LEAGRVMLMELFLLDSVELGASTSLALNAIAASARPAQGFLRAGWFAAAAPESRGIGMRRSNGVPLAAIPTVARKLGPLTVREVSGSYWPYRSFPIAADATDDELSTMMRDRRVRAALGPLWRMGPVYGDDPTAERLTSAAQSAGWAVLRRDLGTCFELDLAGLRSQGPWPRSSTVRKNRWRENRLAELGPVDYRFRTGAEWSDEDRDAMATVEANSWVGKLDEGGNTKFLDPDCRRNWERMTVDPVLADMIVCSIMTIGEAPVAFTFGLEVDKVRYTIANAYDERFARHGPGKLLLYKDFERAAQSGVERISWGSGDPGYKSEMGARPGPAILDLLFVRPKALALALRPIWTRHSGS
jgi:CelD/BcsL family acetyltransferase involved in cellulose biosynthesis